MVGWALPAASLLGSLYMANRGEGGGSEFSPQQEKLFDTQVDIADMMKGLYESRVYTGGFGIKGNGKPDTG